jgi:hypothetical protein
MYRMSRRRSVSERVAGTTGTGIRANHRDLTITIVLPPCGHATPVMPSPIWSVVHASLTDPDPDTRYHAADGIISWMERYGCTSLPLPLDTDTIRILWQHVLDHRVQPMRRVSESVVRFLVLAASPDDRRWMWTTLHGYPWRVMHHVLPHIPPRLVPEAGQLVQSYLSSTRSHREQRDALAIIDAWVRNDDDPEQRAHLMTQVVSFCIHTWPATGEDITDVWIQALGLVAQYDPWWVATRSDLQTILTTHADRDLPTILEHVMLPMVSEPSVVMAAPWIWTVLAWCLTSSTDAAVVHMAASVLRQAIQRTTDPAFLQRALKVCWTCLTDPACDDPSVRTLVATVINHMMRHPAAVPILRATLASLVDSHPTSRDDRMVGVPIQACFAPPWHATIVADILTLIESLARSDHARYHAMAGTLLSYAWGHGADDRVFAALHHLIMRGLVPDHGWLPALLPGLYSPTVGPQVCRLLHARYPGRSFATVLHFLQRTADVSNPPPPEMPSEVVALLAPALVEHPTTVPHALMAHLWRVAPHDALSVIDHVRSDPRTIIRAVQFLALGWGTGWDDAITVRLLQVISSVPAQHTAQDEGYLGLAVAEAIAHGIGRCHPALLERICTALMPKLSSASDRFRFIQRVGERWDDAHASDIMRVLLAIQANATPSDYAGLIEAWGNGWGRGWDDVMLVRLSDLAGMLVHGYGGQDRAPGAAISFLAGVLQQIGKRGTGAPIASLMETVLQWYTHHAQDLPERDRDLLGTKVTDMIVDGIPDPLLRDAFGHRLIDLARTIDPGRACSRIVRWIQMQWARSS